MDNTTTANTKTMATTPFSINDILTKNNTTIYRRRVSSGELSPMSQSNENISDTDYHSSDDSPDKLSKSMHLFKHPSMEQFHHKMQFDHRTGGYIKTERENLVRHSSMTPPNEHFADENLSSRRRSLDCFLIDSNHNNTNRDGSGIERKIPVKSSDHHMKIDYYNYPIGVESPLDMRRCTNDSGEHNNF